MDSADDLVRTGSGNRRPIGSSLVAKRPIDALGTRPSLTQKPRQLSQVTLNADFKLGGITRGQVRQSPARWQKKKYAQWPSGTSAGQLPTSSIVSLLDDLTEALNTATAQLSGDVPGDQGANDEDLANLMNEILDDINTALNKLVPKLGLDELPTPVDTAISGLLTSLDASLVPGLLAALQPPLVGLGGVVG